MLPGVNDYHTNHAAPTRPTKFSPATRSPTEITNVAVPDGIYNPAPASAANAAKPGPAAIGGEVREMMELMHRREAAPFASTDAARAEQRVHEDELLSFAQAERRRRLDMEAEYERKKQLGLLDHSGLGSGFADSTGSAVGGGTVDRGSHAATTAASSSSFAKKTTIGKLTNTATQQEENQAGKTSNKKSTVTEANRLAAEAAAAAGSVMAPRVPAGAGDGKLHRIPEFRLASTALTEETWDTKIHNVERFVLAQKCTAAAVDDEGAAAEAEAVPHAPAERLPPARVVPLPPAPAAAAALPSTHPPLAHPHYFKKQGMAATGDARHAAAAAAASSKARGGKQNKEEATSSLVEKHDPHHATQKATTTPQENFTLHPAQPGDVELRSPQMVDPNEIVILPPGPFSGATATMAPFRRERGW